MPPVSSLGGTRWCQALLGLQQPVQDQQPAHQLVQGVAGDPRVRMVGGLGEKRVGLGLLLKTHPVRVHPRPPRHPAPYAPPAAMESDSEMPERPSRCARALPAKVRAGPCVAELASAPQGAQRVSVAPVARGAWSAAHAAAPSFSPGAARSGIARGPVPNKPVIPPPPISPWEGRSTAHALDLEQA